MFPGLRSRISMILTRFCWPRSNHDSEKRFRTIEGRGRTGAERVLLVSSRGRVTHRQFFGIWIHKSDPWGPGRLRNTNPFLVIDHDSHETLSFYIYIYITHVYAPVRSSQGRFAKFVFAFASRLFRRWVTKLQRGSRFFDCSKNMIVVKKKFVIEREREEECLSIDRNHGWTTTRLSAFVENSRRIFFQPMTRNTKASFKLGPRSVEKEGRSNKLSRSCPIHASSYSTVDKSTIYVSGIQLTSSQFLCPR